MRDVAPMAATSRSVRDSGGWAERAGGFGGGAQFLDLGERRSVEGIDCDDRLHRRRDRDGVSFMILATEFTS